MGWIQDNQVLRKVNAKKWHYPPLKITAMAPLKRPPRRALHRGTRCAERPTSWRPGDDESVEMMEDVLSNMVGGRSGGKTGLVMKMEGRGP